MIDTHRLAEGITTAMTTVARGEAKLAVGTSTGATAHELIELRKNVDESRDIFCRLMEYLLDNMVTHEVLVELQNRISFCEEQLEW